MPITKGRPILLEPTKSAKSDKKYAAQTKFVVVGDNLDLELFHIIPETVDDNGKPVYEDAGTEVRISGEVTAAELYAIGADIPKWLEDGLIQLYNKREDLVLEVEDFPMKNAA